MPGPIDRVDQLPLPSLQWYAGFSGLALFYVVVYAAAAPGGQGLAALGSDIWCIAALLNMGCCCLFLLSSFINSFIFGKLQLVEHQHMRDKFWNFVFYKFIFVFGVMNVQDMRELLCWSVWFSVLGTLMLSEQLCKDRFQFLSFSPNTPASAHAKIIGLLVMIFLSCASLFMVTAIVGWQYGFNHFTFLYSEVFILFARTMHTIIRYIIHLWDMHHDGIWENRSMYTYYAELVLELMALCVDFTHHVHMLLWANMFLSVASLILLMKLRFLYQEIQRRLKRHRSFVLVKQTLEERCPIVPKEELAMSDEVCAICREDLNSARRLPCKHIFHTSCLWSWLERDTVCPTCRYSLSNDIRRGNRHRGTRHRGARAVEGEGEGVEGVAEEGAVLRRERRLQTARRRHNWLLHFNGASIASWLPTFSLAFHQDHQDLGWIGNDAAELHREAQNIHGMFPDVPLQAITLDLADTHSVSLTVERILTEAIFIPEQPPPRPPQHSDSELSSSDEAEPTAEEHTPTLKHPAAGESERIATSEPLLLSRDLSKPRKEGGGGGGGEEEEGVSGEDASESVGAIALSDDGFGDGAIPQTVARVTITDSDSLSPQLRHRRLDGSSSTSEGGVAVLAKQARNPDCPASACEGSGAAKSAAQFSFAALQQRKKDLVERARQRYILKHRMSHDE